jgi:hypothetical protein
MAKTAEAKIKTPSRVAAGARPARVARDGGAPDSGAPAEEAKVVLSQEGFRQIGETLNGTHWQSDVARDLGCSKSQITRYLDTSGNPKTSRALNPLIADQLQYVIGERILELVALFHVEGMPFAGQPEAEAAVDAITKAIDKVPGRRPPRHSAG